MHINQHFKNLFLNRVAEYEFPLLLGLSGGPDSMALFHLLMEYQCSFEVAHVDHGWREESAYEAEQLECHCQKYGLTFHLKKLDPKLNQKDLENACRKERFAFFKHICKKFSLKGILLAHHADDQAETVLKRLFEGAPLHKLKGLVEKSHFDGMAIYRPLLNFSKIEILHYLEARSIAYFHDTTNQDSRFLRSRLREFLIPELSKHFGKQISSSLCRVGDAAAELDEFLENELTPYRKLVISAEEGEALDLSVSLPASPFLLKAVIRDFFHLRGFSVSLNILETVAWHLKKGSCHKEIYLGKRKVRIHRKKITLLPASDTTEYSDRNIEP